MPRCWPSLVRQPQTHGLLEEQTWASVSPEGARVTVNSSPDEPFYRSHPLIGLGTAFLTSEPQVEYDALFHRLFELGALYHLVSDRLNELVGWFHF